MSAERGYNLPLVLFGSVALLSGIGLFVYLVFYNPSKPVAITPLPTPNYSPAANAITDFESCVKAGNPIMESYPRRCNADGRSYTEQISDTTNSQTNVYEHSGDYFKILYPKDWSVNSFTVGANFFSNELPRDIREKIEQTYPLTLPMITVEVVHKEFSLPLDSEDILYTIKPQSVTFGDREGVNYQQLCSPRCGVMYDFPYADGKKTISFSVFNLEEESVASLSAEFNVSINPVNDETVRNIITTAEFE